MALTTYYTPRWRAIDANGAPIAGAILSFFEAGTATPLPVYADVDGSTSLGVTVTADSGGLFAELFMLPQAYDITLTTSAGVPVWTAVDWFPPQAASSANSDQTWTAGVSFTAGEGAYISDGSNGLNAGQAYKWDADLIYASETPEIGFAVSAVAAGAPGLFRTGGQVTGLSGLIPGSLYYLSGTAGAISTTAGAFVRMVGQAISTTVLSVQTNPPISGGVDQRLKSIMDGRLTLTTGVPVTTADVTAATTVYFAPFQGNEVALYTGSRWVVLTFTQLSVAVPATTATMYDVFLDYNAGTPVLAVTAWTNDTTRATALTTQDGVYVQTGNTDWRYLGSFRTTAVSGQTEDSLTKRFVWNYYNRVPRPLKRVESTAQWTYTTATIRQANGAVANQVDVVVGVAEVPVDLSLQVQAQNSTSAQIVVGFGEDSTTVISADGVNAYYNSAGVGAIITPLVARLLKYPAVGRHFYAWLEGSAAAGTTTFYNTTSVAFGTPGQSGIIGWVEG